MQLKLTDDSHHAALRMSSSCGGKHTSRRDSSMVQVVIVQFGGEAFMTHPLDWQQWGACFGIGALSLVVRKALLALRPKS